MLMIDTLALAATFAISIMRVNETQPGLVRTIMWALLAAGTFGLGCEQIIRGKVFGPDIWPVMMHIGLALLMTTRFACYDSNDPNQRVHT